MLHFLQRCFQVPSKGCISSTANSFPPFSWPQQARRKGGITIHFASFHFEEQKQLTSGPAISLMVCLQILLQPRSRAACSFAPLQCSLPGMSKSQLHISAGLNRVQCFHSSCCNWKKKKPPEPALRELGLLRYDMGSLKDSPKPALYLSVAGLIPFVSVPLVMAIQETSYPELAFAQIAYGASVVSFFGGIRWGFALPEGSPAKPDWLNLSNSIVPPILAWLALLLKDGLMEAGTTVIIGLGIALHYDLSLLPTYPSWFKALRAIVTIVAVGSLVATLYIVSIYPEKHLAPASNKVED